MGSASGGQASAVACLLSHSLGGPPTAEVLGPQDTRVSECSMVPRKKWGSGEEGKEGGLLSLPGVIFGWRFLKNTQAYSLLFCKAFSMEHGGVFSLKPAFSPWAYTCVRCGLVRTHEL